MPNPATTGDVEARWRALSASETSVAQTLLDDAWVMVLSRRPTLEADMAAGTVTTANVVRVLSTMVKRVLLNPGGYTQESIDDWTGIRSGDVADGALHITGEELADLTPGRRSRRSLRLVAYGDA